MRSIFIFRNDLRLTDNTTLIYCLKNYKEVLPVFIFDHYQLQSKNHFFIDLMIKAVEDLSHYFLKNKKKLYLFYGNPHKVIEHLIKVYNPDAIAFNKEYSLYSQKRDNFKFPKIISLCDLAFDINYIGYRFGDFKNLVLGKPLATKKNGMNNYAFLEIAGETSIEKIRQKLGIKGKEKATRIDAIKKLKAGEGGISFYLKMGLISPREVILYARKIGNLELETKIIWREFYFQIYRNHLNNYDFYDPRFKQIQWRNDEEEIKKMWSGQTGVPAVDAGVRQLNETGFMNNRSRLLVGFFSVKIYRINPFLPVWGGQAYFSSKLIDCCYANNTGNWHWVASDKVDASGQRFGHGFSGRKFKLFGIEYDKTYAPEEPAEGIEQFCKTRWAEWVQMTNSAN